MKNDHSWNSRFYETTPALPSFCPSAGSPNFPLASFTPSSSGYNSKMKDKCDRGSGCQDASIPHRGFLCKVQLAGKSNTTATAKNTAPFHSSSLMYAITIKTDDGDGSSYANNDNVSNTRRRTHELHFKLEHYTFMERIFYILDTESKGTVNKDVVQEFVMLRCPVFKRRDADLLQYQKNHLSHKTNGDVIGIYGEYNGHFNDYCSDESNRDQGLSTFDEVWNAALTCACNHSRSERNYDLETAIGIEAWMVFCQFISLAQYHDAKRRFSGRHLQTLQKKYGNGSPSEGEDQEQELIIVDLPPLEKPVSLNVHSLLEYDHATEDDGGIPLPELDLDHSYISQHDESKRLQMQSLELKTMTGHQPKRSRPIVQVSVFGSETDVKSNIAPQPADQLEFIIRYIPCEQDDMNNNSVIVRRSFEDMEWLHKTFKSHKQLGGTLCGRILPSFPSRLDSASGRYDEDDYSSYGYGAISSSLGSIATTSNKTAVAVASAGVGMVSSAAKTAKSLIWGKSKSKSKSPISSAVKKAVTSTSKLSGIRPSAKKSTAMTNTDNNHSFDVKAQYSRRYSYAKKSSNTPAWKAKQLERYLNYMLEHPALSTSFPLNLILKASQSGLEAAKNILENQSQNQFGASNLHEEMSNGGDLYTPYSSVLRYLPSPSQTKNLKWVRTAAQAALVLQVHGLLETAGYQSTSTKLQHASLPQFASNKARGSGDSNGSMDEDNNGNKDGTSYTGEDSCLFYTDDDNDECDGFDVLPEPLPLSERSALCAGRTFVDRRETTHGKISSNSDAMPYDGSYRGDLYGMHNNTSLGDIDVERDTVRLRDLLRKVDKSFSLCCKAMSTIGENRHARAQIQMSILRSIDSWEGMRGKILAQRPLLNGVNSLEDTSRLTDACYVEFSQDMLWNASLATSAVTASEEVCDAVNTAKTASRAKKTADTAVYNLQELGKKGNETPEERKNLQERGSKLRMQALHAAVLEHEAESAKKRSVVSLANDVKYWNSHRKRELLHACSKIARAQKMASTQNLNAWKELKDGLLEFHHILPSKLIISDQGSKRHNPETEHYSDDRHEILHDFTKEPEESETDFYQSTYPREDATNAGTLHDQGSSVHMYSQEALQIKDHFYQLAHPEEESTKADEVHDQDDSAHIPTQESMQSKDRPHRLSHHEEDFSKADIQHGQGNKSHEPFTNTYTPPISSPNPVAVANDIASEVQQDYFTPTPSENDETLFGEQNHSECDYADAQDSAYENFEYTDVNPEVAITPVTNMSSEFMVPVLSDDDKDPDSKYQERKDDDDGMTDSMQSLVDGLLQWGGNWEDDDLNINLPQGMAASLVMENRGVLDLQ